MAGKPFHTIIVDDELKAISLLQQHLVNYKQIRCIGAYTNPEEAIEHILSEKPDLLFLDIQMPEKTGFDIVKEIKSDHYSPQIIFITAFERYAIEAIRHAAFDYLLKPINPLELAQTLERMDSPRENLNFPMRFERLMDKISQAKQLKFNTCSGFIILDTDEIIYCEACRNYCEIYLIDDRSEVVTLSLNEVGKLLPETSFFRISRFHIINLKFLRKVERRNHTAFLQVGGETIQLKISARNSKLLEQRFVTT
ncbi:MAG: response regulator transcription factor [Bacteroidales bacterium]|nr:response regulator transcription factor [Bacteroidales bacterium]